MNKVFILTIFSLFCYKAHAQIREFQTSRLMSTAGAGVASILSSEAAVLNPAASAFFEGSSFSYQSYKTSLQKKNSIRDTAPDQFPGSNTTQGIFMSDNDGPVKGGVAYINQAENNFNRERMTLHAGAPIGTATAMGFSYSYLRDKLPTKFSTRHKTRHQATIGLTHILDEDTILGIVIIDPSRATSGEERAIAGFQYNLADRFMIIGDAGIQYTKSASKKYLWRAALQMNIFSDFFLKVGKFQDNITELKGTGWGVSWIGPRFGVEFAQKISEQTGSGNYFYEDEKVIDTSLSAILKF